MPRISLWKPEKGNDYKMIDRVIREHFNAGGTGVFVHKYLGPHAQASTTDATQPDNSVVRPTNIQDLLFLENRDRKYDTDVYDMRGVYQVADSEFDLTQFGAFLSNDTIFLTFHLNDMVNILGRKLMSGDVIELPHQREDMMLDMARLEFTTKPAKKFRKGETITGASSGATATVVNFNQDAKVLRMVTDGVFIAGETVTGSKSTASGEVAKFYPEGPMAMNRYYVIEDAARGSEGYSPTWFPHIWRVKCTPITDSQEFSDILGTGENKDDLKNLISTYQSEIDISEAIVNQAQTDVPKKGVENSHLYINKADQYIPGKVYAHWQTNQASIKLYQSTDTNWQTFDYLVSSTKPTTGVSNGTLWLDTANTNWGLYVGNGTTWSSQAVSHVDNANIDGQTKAPISSYAPTNNYAVVSIDGAVGSTYYKKVSNGSWVKIATDSTTTTLLGVDVAINSSQPSTNTNGKIWLQPNTTGGLKFAFKQYSATIDDWETVDIALHSSRDSANDAFGFANKIGIHAGDGTPPNGIAIAHTGSSFPNSLNDGDYVLRTDYNPNRLFKKVGNRFIKIEDDMRGTYSAANRILNTFVENANSNSDNADGKEQQGLSKAVKPKTD
tara:strand:+ start:84860 stop:86695 length:1836 start_codon:yes stop_codon:yes gene_type:complete